MRRRAPLAVALAAVWAVAAYVLWRSRVPDGLHLGGLDVRQDFGAAAVARSRHFQSVELWLELGSIFCQLAVLAVYTRWGARWVRESAAGPVGTGMLLGMLGLGFVWASQLPIGVVQVWWERRYGVSKASYVTFAFAQWPQLVGAFLSISLALAIVMGLARRLGQRWWIPGSAVFVAIALLYAFVTPWLAVGTHPLAQDSPKLAAAAAGLERREGVAPTPVRVADISSQTSAPNAFAAGFGPSRRIVVYDTLLDGRFTQREVRVVLAHEIGHLARWHIWKSLGWYALFAVPGAFLIALVTRRRGGMGEPEAVPLALLTLVVLSLVALPARNAISRHLELEADWQALQAARDPAAQRALFRAFVPATLSDPDPGTVEYLLFEDHPTLAQRVALVAAWQRRYAAAPAQSP